MLTAIEELVYKSQLEGLKTEARIRLKAAIIDPRAMYNDLKPEEAAVIIDRTARIFKFLTTLGKKVISNWIPADFIDFPTSMETCKPREAFAESLYVFERFLEKGDLDFGSEFGLTESELIGCIMHHTWETKNSANIDFTVFCNVLKLDEATYNMVKRALCAKSKDDNEVKERLAHAMCTYSDLHVLITMAHAEATKWPFKMDWKAVTIKETSLSVEDLKAHNKALDGAIKSFVATDNAHINNDLRETIKALEEANAEAEEKLKAALAEIDRLSNVNFVDMIEEHEGVLEERRTIAKNTISLPIRAHKTYSNAELNSMLSEAGEVRTQTTILRQSPSDGDKRTFQQQLELRREQTCLARHSNSRFFSPAKIVNKQVGTAFTVQFLDSHTVCSVDPSDIANAELPLFSHCLGNNYNRFIGMRVVALVESAGKGKRWLPGTVGATFGSHADSFLVFFDDKKDRYVKPVYKRERTEARKFLEMEKTRPHSNNGLLQWIVARAELLCMFPLCEQAFNNTGNEIARTSVFKLVTESDEIYNFLHRYFEKFPDWPLVRMRKPVPDSIPQRIIMADRKAAFVVDVDRAMCLLRYPRPGAAGDDCFAHPCMDPSHHHRDEWLYRGSTRFNTVNLESINNTNLSTRQINRNRAYYTEDTKKPTARKSGVPCNGHLSTQPQMVHKAISKEELARQKLKANRFKYTTIKCDVPKPVYNIHPKCGRQCLKGLDKNPLDIIFKETSPLAIPMLCGWARNVYTMNSRGISIDRLSKYSTVQVCYTTPCGLTLRTLEQIGTYLNRCDSQLTIDLFTKREGIDPFRTIEVEKTAVVDPDFSQGKEHFPIPAINTIDDEKPPKVIYCSRKYPFDERVNISTINKNFCSGCSCDDDCSDPSRCECQQLTKETVNRLAKSFRPKLFGYDKRILQGRTCSGIFECNQNCSCNSNKCFNRVVQNEIKYPIQMFKTAGCGWGIRAATDIPQGAFIANYVGALMTDEIAESKGHNDDQYFADLDLNDVVETEKTQALNRLGHLDVGSSDDDDDDSHFVPDMTEGSSGEEAVPAKRMKGRRGSQEDARNKRKKMSQKRLKDRQREIQTPMFKWSDYFGDREQLFVLDAKYKGNIGRFLNHSCDPNVHVQHVLVDTHDLRLPWSSFFATRDIRAGEELCWNYNYHLDEERPENLRITCHCGSKYCIGRLL